MILANMYTQNHLAPIIIYEGGSLSLDSNPISSPDIGIEICHQENNTTEAVRVLFASNMVHLLYFTLCLSWQDFLIIFLAFDVNNTGGVKTLFSWVYGAHKTVFSHLKGSWLKSG